MKNKNTPIAIVAVSSILPGSNTTDLSWKHIQDGKDFIREVPSSHWLPEDYYDPNSNEFSKIYAKTGAFLSDIPFDPVEFNMPPNTLASTDTNQLLALIAAKRLMLSTRSIREKKVDPKKISIILGIAAGSEMQEQMSSKIQKPVWKKVLLEHGLQGNDADRICASIEAHYPDWTENTFPGLLSNVVAGRVANKLNLGGCNFVTDAACASSLAAINMAMLELQGGRSDIVFSGGVDALSNIFMYMCFTKTPALSPTGDIRPFSNEGDGTILGEGVALFALRRLEDAERDGDEIHAVINACGSSSDGKFKSIYAPSPEGQSRAINNAYESLDYGLGSVELIEAHGTGTKAGDAAEFEGLRLAFANDPTTQDKDPQYCALGSIKSQIGHAKSTAGGAGLLKAMFALRHKVLPPTIKVKTPNDKLDIHNSSLYLNTETRPWIKRLDQPRRAAVSSFGFGGSNFHLAVEEYTGAQQPKRIYAKRDGQEILLTLSATTPAELVQNVLKLKEKASGERTTLLGLARASHAQVKEGHAFRLSLLAKDKNRLLELVRLLEGGGQIAAGKNFTLPGSVYLRKTEQLGKTAFLFAGQGGQYLNMGRDLLCQFDQARAPWDECCSMNSDDSSTLAQVVYPLPVFTDEARRAQEAELSEIQWIQPALGALSLSHLEMLNAVGVKADAFAGHSYGELPALYAAGAISSKQDLMEISAKRAELMKRAVALPSNRDNPGGMSAVLESPQSVSQLLEGFNGEVGLANLNSPKQTVITGSVKDIARFEQILAENQISFKRLNVPTAFHSPWVASVSEDFKAYLDGKAFNLLEVPLFSNLTGERYPAASDGIRRELSEQVAQQVRFVDEIEKMKAFGVTTFIEMGPGKALSQMVKDTLGDAVNAVSMDLGPKVDSVSAFWRGIGELSALGVPMDLAAIWDAFAPEENEPRQEDYSKATIMINGANYGKVYPAAKSKKSPLPEPVKLRAATVAAASEPFKATVKDEPRFAKPIPPTPPTAKSHAPSQTERFMTNSSTDNKPSTERINKARPSSEYLVAIQTIQETAFQAQQAFQRTLAQSHQSYLESTQSVLASLAGSSMAGRSAPVRFEQTSSVVAPPIPAPTFVPAAPVHVAAPTSAPAPTPAMLQPQRPVHHPVKSVEPVTPAPSVEDFTPLLLKVVADKTGYPEEMLGLDLDMESGLGIDSIKRVEILSALQESIPALKDVDTTKLAAMNTLAEILAFSNEVTGNSNTAPVASPASQLSVPSAASVSTAEDFTPLLLKVVADKTGYPEEMLGLDLDMESGLGIDSIKRVEILSALQESIPALKDVDTTKLAAMNTLAEILAFANEVTGNSAAPASQSVITPSAAEDFTPLLLKVVAEKTGYPEEMLGLDVDMESGLGIDSIKRVEILSALQESIPALKDVDTTKLATMNTLAEILAFANEVTGNSAAPAGQSMATPSAAEDFTPLLLKVVAEKTGYPEEMLGLDVDMESGLGIDSIKRVEILSALQESIPALKDVDTTKLAAMNTLAEILAFANEVTGNSAAPAGQSMATPSAAEDFTPLLLKVVAEKTGYPEEMLGLDVDMESGLGIDSIKRVEILSALQESIPALKDVDTTKLAAMNTLAEILAFANEVTGNSAAPAGQSMATPSAAEDFTPLLLKVVAEKTGYPEEMLGLEVDMESGLGIDSIKRVEILSALQEHIPALKDVDTTKLAAMNTLAEILAFANGVEAEGAYPKSERDGNTAQEIPPAVTQEKTSFRYPVTRTARSLSGIAVAGLNHPAPITIVPDSQGIAQLLAEKLEEAGLKTAIKSFNDCCAQPGSRVIYLEGLSPETENWEEVNYRAFSLAKQTPILQENESGLFVCVHQSSKGMAQSYASGLSALIKTANKEWEGYGLKSIDLLKAISPEEACQIIFRELVAGGAEVEVAYESPCKRFVYESPDVEVEVSFDNAPIQQHDVWVVSGGLKGVTAECLVTFVKKTPLKLAILGRSELQKEPAATLGIQDDTQLKRILLNEAKSQGKQITPIELMAAVARVHSSREMAFNLKRLQDAGAVVEYFSCDIGDLPSVERCLDQVRSKLGSINGIIHGAGVLADKLIRDKTEAQYRRVFNTKVNGFKNLLQLTHADPVNVICCFASVAARTGNVGQCDYAMANEVLNKVCRMEKARRLAAGTPCVVKSINWGPWDGGMVSPQLKSHFESLGIGLLPLEAGANAFVDELYEAPGGEVEVVIGGAMDNWALGKALPFQELDLYIHPDLQPWLLDHKIKGSVVVPAMMVSEWFLNAGEIALGKPVAIHDFKVIKGIMLGAFDAQGSWCLITVKQNSDGCDVRLASATGTIHYSSRAVALDATVSTTLNAAKDESVIAEGAWRIEEVYPRCLFHGPAFQVVEQLLHVSPQTATASLKHANPLSSSLYDWKSDVAIMDGGLQLALLWAMEQSDKDTLPTGYKSLMVNPALGGSHVGEAIFTQFTPRSHNGFRTCGDLLFSNAQGEVIAAIHGLEISSATSDLIYRSAKGLV